MLQIEITAQAVVSPETQGRKVLSDPQKAGGKGCPEERGKRVNLFVCLRGMAAEASCHAAPSYGSQAPTNTCLMTRFIHSVTISSSLPLRFL